MKFFGHGGRTRSVEAEQKQNYLPDIGHVHGENKRAYAQKKGKQINHGIGFAEV